MVSLDTALKCCQSLHQARAERLGAREGPVALSPRADRGQSTDVTTVRTDGTRDKQCCCQCLFSFSGNCSCGVVEFCTPKHLNCREELEIHLGNAFREGKMRA